MSFVVRPGGTLDRAEQRRADLIATAAQLITDRGYHDTTVSDITNALGASHGTFYNYFRNRREILDAVLDQRFSEIQAHVLGKDEKQADTLDEFVAAAVGIAGRLQTSMVNDPGLIRFLAYEAPAIDQELIDKIDGWLNGIVQLTSRQIAHGVDAGYLRSEIDSEMAGWSVTALIFAAAAGGLAGPGDVPGDAFIAALADLLRHGLGATPTQEQSQQA
ncbi:transcriptional regulator, TetR family [Nocardia farcinica]|uniref:Fatty acid metabolism regulator protein n=1 Tax=Nocardia farcinica TaxID=37329 RepID=A0A0H5NR58_NOCFR|nr:TetR/AcrR family transcriptional regulator [Nocardia farcinica]AXK85844.1 TetR/AcrR family transcriptional regulator [Nocardia farcinica]MBA4859190.1 TetR/AcrR family transcriptional regulator [Nocardia farcinica]MBC9819028.1 TetR/AcrR family transcriptional regulator [Nocardia farcinica]PFW98770.1 Fatty acid metabolism regulator protein [Nocardia farcinica]PFX04391.1 Fatty acid metabolism regulator protein [Nocardia farcinica]